MQALPAVFPGNVQAVIARLPVGGQIAQAVHGEAVVRETDVQMLRHRDGDGVVRIPVAEDGAQLLAHGLLPVG